MENQGGVVTAPTRHVDASRPSLGFPLGTALLLIIIFSLSGFFSCCYHWDKLRSLRRSFASDDADLEADSIGSPTKPSHTYPVVDDSEPLDLEFTGNMIKIMNRTNLKQSPNESMPVIMPGDQIPKFIALPCPCAPPREEKITVEVQTPPTPPPPPPPPPRIVYNQVARFGVYYDG